MKETLFQSASDAADMLRRKAISSRELTAMLLARIDAVNPALNSVVELRREAALREAAAADDVIARGGDAGPLHGVRWLHSDPGELLRCLRTETERRDRPADGLPAARSPSRAERHEVHVRGGSARPVCGRSEDGIAGHQRTRGPGGEGLFLSIV